LAAHGSSTKREFTLLLPVPLVLKYEALCTREEHRTVHRLSVAEVNEVINALAIVAESVQIRFLWRLHIPAESDHVSCVIPIAILI